MLRISPEKVCYLIVKLREFDAKEAPEGDYDGSNATDDGMMSVLEDNEDDAVYEELETFLGGLNVDEMEDVLALTYVGRGDIDKAQWAEAIATARVESDEGAVKRLLSIPLLSDYLENGLSEFNLSCEEFEMGHL